MHSFVIQFSLLSQDPNFKLKTKAGPTVIKTTQEGAEAIDPDAPPPAPPDASSVTGIEVGMRCEADPGHRRGTVRFVGDIAATGFWVGVQFDEPVGRNDGTVKGTATSTTISTTIILFIVIITICTRRNKGEEEPHKSSILLNWFE